MGTQGSPRWFVNFFKNPLQSKNVYEIPICFYETHTSHKPQMECLRFGFDFSAINRNATIISSKVLDLPVHQARRSRRRGGHGRGRGRGRTFFVVTPPPPPPVQLKMYKAPTFSIDLSNLFEVLDM
jgi:hypothetical protein